MHRRNTGNTIRAAGAALILTLLCGYATVEAQTIGTSARLTGMGNSSAGLVRGLDALNVNPAQLVPDDGVTVSFGVLPFGAQAGADFMDYSTYNQYFTGTPDAKGKRTPTYLTSADKQAILNTFSGETGHFTHDIRYTLFNAMLSTRAMTVAVGITERTGSNVALPRSFAEFMFFGNEPGKAFDFSNTEVSSSWTRDYSLTVAQEFRLYRRIPILVGASLKLVHGYAYFGIDRFNSSFVTDPETYEVRGTADMVARYAGTSDWIGNNNDFHYSLFPTPVGTGFGVDIGAHMKLTRMFSAGFSLVDLGSVSWDRGAHEITANEDFVIDDLSSTDQVDEIQSRLNGTEYEIPSFSTPLPSAMIISGVLSLPDMPRRGKYWHFTFAYRQGFNDMSGNSTHPRIGVGTEIELLYNVAFRFGVNVGGVEPIIFGAGVGFIADNFKLDIGTMDITPHLNDSFSAVAVGVSSHWDI
ncbi:hypothetical protein KQI65_13130 [bacterium]|nr:hypothetical protein [bacterium]